MKWLALCIMLIASVGCRSLKESGSEKYDGPLVRDDGTAVEAPSW